MPKQNLDFLGVNYYATATVAAAKNDGTDCQPRNGDQQVMIGEEGVYRAAKNEYLELTDFGWMVDSIGMRVTLRRFMIAIIYHYLLQKMVWELKIKYQKMVVFMMIIELIT